MVAVGAPPCADPEDIGHDGSVDGTTTPATDSYSAAGTRSTRFYRLSDALLTLPRSASDELPAQAGTPREERVLRRSSRLGTVGAEVKAAASVMAVGSDSGGDEVGLAVAAGMAVTEAHLNAADATPPTGGAPMSPEHADGLDERPLPVAESRQSIVVRVRSGLLARMAPLHAALATYGGTTGNVGYAALATEATVDDVEAGSKSGSASIEGVGEWGVTVVDASDGGSETEHRKAIVEVDYWRPDFDGNGTDPAVVANVRNAIKLNEAQLSHEPILNQRL